MTKTELVSEYEKKHNIPEDDRLMTYIAQYGCYMQKIGVTEEEIEERYQIALREYENEEKRKLMIGVYTSTGKHNLKDISRYASKNFDNMINSFFADEFVKKELGVENDGTYYHLLTYRNDSEYPEMEVIPDCDIRDNLINLQREWFLKLVDLSKELLLKQTKEVAEMSGYIAPKQRINYTREIKKIISQKKCIFDARLDGYDFREVDCSNMFFYNCNFNDANFAHCNLQNTVFVNCKLDNAIFYGANTNGCIKTYGEPEEIVDSHKNISNGKF